MTKTRRVRKSNIRTRRRLRGGNNSNNNASNANNGPQYDRASFKFNYELFNSMKPNFLNAMPFSEKYRKYLNTSAILSDVEMYIKQLLENNDVIDTLLAMDDISNNVDDELYEYIMFNTPDEVERITYTLAFNVWEFAGDRDSDAIYSYIKLVVLDYINRLPKANRTKNAMNIHKVMSEKVPDNIAARIAAYSTGVEPRNNPAYMQ